MLYYLSLLKEDYGFFNLFQYITFRTGGAIITAIILCFIIGPKIIKKLRHYKIGQIQRQDGPSTHLSKHGTPTMGGVMILISLLTTVLLWARLDNRFIWVLAFVTIMLAIIGIIDDYTKLVKKDPNGVSAGKKLIIQIFTASVVVGYFTMYPPNPDFFSSISVPYMSGVFINLGIFYAVLQLLIIVGSSNAVNFTDGLDGLAAGSMILCVATYAIFAYLAGNMNFAEYLKIIPVAGSGEIAVFMGALIGACLGFLWFNSYPAEVFMGDTSSLFLGGILGTTAICVRQELILPIVGGIFVAETLSVILQVGYFKYSGGKRLFKMAPLHHHFELKGLAEPKVIIRFWIVGILLMLLALASLKIR
ncbi:MAG: phospho-N-acetylmuramoyl-pentapeptide-transferase [Elusimicrobiaceae bacterium]|jgi:phospho-N-acetylmuramoyl-pentapeptide-transferase|nr:phospho-N-acetylmuramoyl-pentapeptide-transferase [Elusimicrobiaceae bacterium]MBT3954672.1 phospho-N-acetylmuramoyl-pentapeptide-transferase [Elusimicrobiaceae bacterium]MBT4007854.1 phospho-N-acetylmuramoyl-pentapeptide-transferase [Elusimicrobiaceae bacterium]MBT4402875.1 phospho-N-acetylmuramoyl-pentapeptide-transferase [Elusimicrobiaceae bacterium]MBT4440109.1 phospho-N-acetylmuramoyl-pentapeptide-transferase [Elusimicrobiaceae bacterium]